MTQRDELMKLCDDTLLWLEPKEDGLMTDAQETALKLARALKQILSSTVEVKMNNITKTGIPLTWGRNRRDGKEHTEWHAPCGCAWHPNPAPHWHPCSIHTPQAGEE
jgi:hypothetical protein